ncbi:MAG TPA: rhodanese-like domain-containing protein [Candidatus Wallbacteria bacterium]|nr:MAG: molybdopterin biosynthesis protein MoeB [bacterium ADurb.Bin243]HOD39395.1 rhodanese-like domain-containing protein [Candidatus Wallbacteria bacterium]HPG56449.1 rhodanese-like domain-containing protein [Candidatus Wallbacteria bacterium]
MKTLMLAAAALVLITALKASMIYAGESVDVKELKKIMSDGGFAGSQAAVLDVREDDEFKEGHIKGAVHIPLGEISRRFAELKKIKKLYVICYSGARSSSACKIISKLCPEITAVNVSDGMSGWYGSGFEIKK